MYLRLGWVVGNAGVLGALLIVLLAHAISVPTSLSIASLASDRAVGGGGVYYIISRSLGLPLGASIGVALYLATALGASLYIIGFAGSINALIGLADTPDNLRITGTITLFALTVLTILSANLAIKAQYVIMAVIAVSIASLFAGSSPSPPTEVMLWPASPDVPGVRPISEVFAVYFPAVTGFTAGVAMSGDLKDPRRAIPVGTLAAVGVGMLIYVGLVLYLGLTVDSATLRGELQIWEKASLVPQAIIAGIWGATLSSAIGSMLGAPRILQALAIDRVAPAFLGAGSAATNEPRAAIVATFVIAEAGVLIADLDAVATLLTMFFLTTYGTLNLACGLERWSNPDFRPRFRVPAWLSFAGAGVCGGTMFKLDVPATGASVTALALLYLFVKQRRLELKSSSIWAVIWEQMVRAGLYRLQKAPERRATWRPNILLFGGHPVARPHLLHMAQWIVQEHGLLTNFLLEPTGRAGGPRAARDSGVFGDTPSGDNGADGLAIDDEGTDPSRVIALSEVDAFDLHSVFHTTRKAPTVEDGVRMASDWFGMVGMEPNAVMLGWPTRQRQHARYGELVRDLIDRDRNVLLLSADPHIGFRHRLKLDIWWGENQINGGLMLMLAHFIQSTPAWSRARVRVVTLARSPKDVGPRKRALKGLLARGRVRAEVIVMDGSAEPESPLVVLRDRSKRADLVIMGVPRPTDDDLVTWVAGENAKTAGIRAVLRVSAATGQHGGQPLGLEDDVHVRVDEHAEASNPLVQAVLDA